MNKKSSQRYANPAYSINTYAHPNKAIRVKWHRKNPVKDLTGREVYFLPFVHMDMSDVYNLTPNKLYKVIQHIHGIITIEDDEGMQINPIIDHVSSHLNGFPFFIKKETTSNG